MKLSLLDGISIGLLTVGLAAGVAEHVPVAAPWAFAFAVYVVVRIARDVFTEWRTEKARQRVFNVEELAAMHKALRELQALAESVTAEREAMHAKYAALEADFRAMQSQSNWQQSFGVPPLNMGPSFGPTRGG